MLLSQWLNRYQTVVPTYFIARTTMLAGFGMVALLCVLRGVHGGSGMARHSVSLDPLAISSLLMVGSVLSAHLYLLLVYPIREAAAYPRPVSHPLLLALVATALLLYGVFFQLALRAGADIHLLLSASAVVVGGLGGLSWRAGILVMLAFNAAMTLLLPVSMDPWFWGFMLCAQWVVYVLFKALIGEFHTKTLLFQRLVELQATQRLLRDSVEQDLRHEMARNLHDEIGHLATRLSLTLAQMGQENAIAQEAQALTKTLHHQLRTLASGWSGGAQLDVKTALEALVRPIAQPRIALQFEGFDGRCAPAIAEAIFRACQEGITNCLRHSDASELTITLHKGPQGFRAELRDNGRAARLDPQGSGLKGIDARVRQLGGVMEYGALADGFRLAFTLPEPTHAH